MPGASVAICCDTRTDQHLEKRACTLHSPQVSAIITEDLGSPPEALFVEFDPKPIASASLAQVRSGTGCLQRWGPFNQPQQQGSSCYQEEGCCARLFKCITQSGSGRVIYYQYVL